MTTTPFPTLAAIEREHICAALRMTCGNRTHAAKMLGIAVRTMRNKVHLYQLAGEFPPGGIRVRNGKFGRIEGGKFVELDPADDENNRVIFNNQK